MCLGIPFFKSALYARTIEAPEAIIGSVRITTLSSKLGLDKYSISTSNTSTEECFR